MEREDKVVKKLTKRDRKRSREKEKETQSGRGWLVQQVAREASQKIRERFENVGT